MRFPKLTDCVEHNICSMLTFYRVPRLHTNMKITKMIDRIDEWLRRRTRVVRPFPNIANCLHLPGAPCVDTHETWLGDYPHINMDLLREERKNHLNKAT